jgi:hypothetical protein
MTRDQAERWVERPLRSVWQLVPYVAFEPVAKLWRWWALCPSRLQLRDAVDRALVPSQLRKNRCGRCGAVTVSFFIASAIDPETGLTSPYVQAHACGETAGPPRCSPNIRHLR